MPNKKNLLIYAHYYIPDTASTWQILRELAEGMLDKFIYNIQDFNPEQVLAVGYTKSKFITDAMMWFDKFSCKRSDLIITVGREVVFAFVGAGSVLDKLVLYVKKHHMDNVKFIPYQDKADLIYSLNAGDVHWCVNTKGIKGVSCPSNVYPPKLVA